MVLYHFFQITFFLIFTSELSAYGCQIEIKQPQELTESEDKSVFVPCYFNISACPSSSHKVLWYVFRSDSHHQLDTNQPLKYTLESQGLQINSFTSSDEGVYYCAVILSSPGRSGAQAFGSGTTVTVEEHVSHTGQFVLLALLVLLTLYSLTILTLIICIKTGRSSLFSNGRFRRSDKKADSSKQVLFGAVVQEFYNKRNLGRNKKNPTEVLQQNKFGNPQTSASKEDIYQNLNKTG